MLCPSTCNGVLCMGNEGRLLQDIWAWLHSCGCCLAANWQSNLLGTLAFLSLESLKAIEDRLGN